MRAGPGPLAVKRETATSPVIPGDRRILPPMTIHALYPGDTPPNEPDPQIVAWCEQLLADAKAGEIRALAFVALREPGISKRWFKAQSRLGTSVLGTMRILEAEIIEELLDQSEDAQPDGA